MFFSSILLRRLERTAMSLVSFLGFSFMFLIKFCIFSFVWVEILTLYLYGFYFSTFLIEGTF